MTDWRDKKVLVTGGSQGIGWGIAHAFLRAGAQVLIAGRDRTKLTAAQTKLAESGRCQIVETDVADPDQCTAMASACADLLGGLDVLCANAGVYPEQPLRELNPQSLHHVFSVNTYATIYCVQACTELLAESAGGRIVVTSSITGPVTGYAGLSHYGASKSAQVGFIRSAALELAQRGITINAVLPGSIRTEGLDGLGADAIERMISCIPQRRLGSPSDIGAAALYFASDEAGFVTGQSLVVDGGQTLPEHPDAF